jgi:hypothetical protein
MSRILLVLIILALTATPASANKTTSQKAVVWLPIAKATILTGQDYF